MVPWGGLTVGYRLPSRRLHRQWRKRSGKGRRLRIEDSKTQRASKLRNLTSADAAALVIDSLELEQLRLKSEATERNTQQMGKRNLQQNGRSYVFAEFFGATGGLSVNYSYTHPIARSKIFMMEYGAGFGTDFYAFGIPVQVGVKAMKNYRGAGVSLGVLPQFNVYGQAGMLYFLRPNVEFYVAYGITVGVAFYVFHDPGEFIFFEKWTHSAGFSIGYRLRAKKK